jgi:hypothetical protein
MIRIWLPTLLVLILLLSSQSLPIITTSCGNNSRCISNTLCKLCEQGKGPECPIPICINGCCGEIRPCSLTLTGVCSEDDGCMTPELCELCNVNEGPACFQGMCLNGNCTLIRPCSISTRCSSVSN